MGEFVEERELGPNPHARPTAQLLRAYVRGAGLVAPQVFLNPWLTPAAIKRLALWRFRKIVAHARRSAPFYREHLKDVDVDAIRDLRDVHRVPFLTKALLRENADRMLSSDAAPREHLSSRASSGSSGAPVKVFFDPLGDLPRRVQELRLLTAHGFRPWHTQLVFDHPAHLSPKRFLLQHARLWRREIFPSWLPVEEALKRVNELEPEVLHGVLSSLRLMALAVHASGGLTYRPRLAVTKGELLDGKTRKIIEDTLHARVVDYYATEETGIIAWECPSRSGYHIDLDHVLVETVREDGTPTDPGEAGEIVLTNLYARTMPFIRYRVGDLAVLGGEPCPCGRGLPLLTNLQGRKVDLVATPDGHVFHPMVLMAVMEEIPEIRMFRIAQTQLDRLRVEVMWGEGTSSETKVRTAARLKGDLGKILGSSVRTEVAEVAEFSHGLAEKFALVKGLGRQIIDSGQGTLKVRF